MLREDLRRHNNNPGSSQESDASLHAISGGVCEGLLQVISATPVDGSGLVKLLSLRVVSGSILFYAAGVSAVAAQRFDLLDHLFSLQRVNRYNGGYEPLAFSLDAESGYENARQTSTRVFNSVAPLLNEALFFGAESLNDSWQLFEVLRLAWATYRDPRFAQLQSEYDEKNRTYQEANTAFEQAEQGNGDVNSARPIRSKAWQNRDRVLGSLSRLAPVKRPHVLTADLRMDERYQSVTATRLIHDMNAEGAAHPLVASGFCNDANGFRLAVSAVSTRLGVIGSELSWRRVQNTVGTVPSQMWLDTGKTPGELAVEAARTAHSATD